MSFTMWDVRFLVFLFIAFGCHVYSVKSQACTIRSALADKITLSYSTLQKRAECWQIRIPSNSFVQLNVTVLTPQSCTRCKLEVSVADTGERYTFCDANSIRNPVTALSHVNVTYTHLGDPKTSYTSRFALDYIVKDTACAQKDSFYCNNHTCVARSKVCDGMKDCRNGADELKCESNVESIEGVTEARASAVSWLISKRTSSWGWREDTARAVVALYLTGAANFNGTDLEEELMAKQAELRTAVALFRPFISNSELSMFVNALLVTCHDPRHFYGNNLVRRLKTQIESSDNFTHPVAYLTLCNANESWPLKATADLTAILESDSDYPFVDDLKAMSIMAISCMVKHSKSFGHFQKSNMSILYRDTIKRFKKLQQPDGSFGTVYTTALITQALIASKEHTRDWKLRTTVNYLMKELNSSSVDFLITYLTLPMFNGNTLTDIASVNCSANPRKHKHDLISEIGDFVGPKIRIRYSLYIGDERDVIHTISLHVPENYTAFDVMTLAEVEDPKYKFEWKKISGKTYVYQIAKVTNDSEAGKFWLLFVSSANSAESLEHLTKGPEKVIMEDGQHLIMWYKTAHI